MCDLIVRPERVTGTEYNDGICDLELAQRLMLFVHAQEEETGFTNSLISLIFLVSDDLQWFQEILNQLRVVQN